MIDINTEHLIPIRDLPRTLPPRRAGRRIHISAIYRWLKRGVRGVRLESVTLGGTTYTSKEALQRFAEGLSQTGPPNTETPSTSAIRRKQVEKAAHEVEAILSARQSRVADGTHRGTS